MVKGIFENKMKKWLKFILIFALIFGVIGFTLGQIIHPYFFSCEEGKLCFIQPTLMMNIFWGIIGVIGGGIIGFIISFF